MRELPLACSLETGALEQRLERWRRLNEAELIDARRGPASAILRYRARGEAEGELRELVRLERECCPFLELSLERGDDVLVLEVTGPAEAAEVIDGFTAAGAAVSRPS